jgi:hypothetical protein
LVCLAALVDVYVISMGSFEPQNIFWLVVSLNQG